MPHIKHRSYKVLSHDPQRCSCVPVRIRFTFDLWRSTYSSHRRLQLPSVWSGASMDPASVVTWRWLSAHSHVAAASVWPVTSMDPCSHSEWLCSVTDVISFLKLLSGSDWLQSASWFSRLFETRNRKTKPEGRQQVPVSALYKYPNHHRGNTEERDKTETPSWIYCCGSSCVCHWRSDSSDYLIITSWWACARLSAW